MSKIEKKWKKGVWQYLIDHSKPTKEGLVVRIVIKSEGNFWARVRARQNGTYSRYDMKKVQDRLLKAYYFDQNIKKRATKLNKLQQEGSWHIKLLFKIKRNITIYLESKLST